jgi:hypothetical protein
MSTSEIEAVIQADLKRRAKIESRLEELRVRRGNHLQAGDAEALKSINRDIREAEEELRSEDEIQGVRAQQLAAAQAEERAAAARAYLDFVGRKAANGAALAEKVKEVEDQQRARRLEVEALNLLVRDSWEIARTLGEPKIVPPRIEAVAVDNRNYENAVRERVRQIKESFAN